MVRAPDVTGCSNLTHRRAPLIATLEVQRYKRGYDLPPMRQFGRLNEPFVYVLIKKLMHAVAMLPTNTLHRYITIEFRDTVG